MNEFPFNYIDSANEVINIINNSAHNIAMVHYGLFEIEKFALRDLGESFSFIKCVLKIIQSLFIFFI